LLRNHGPDDAYKNISIEDTKHSVSLLSSPQTQQLYHIKILYLPGYTIKGAVLRIIKETHNIRLAVHNTSSEMEFFKGVQEVIEQIAICFSQTHFY
jgi:hypothetical protein